MGESVFRSFARNRCEDTPETAHPVLPPESGALSGDAPGAVHGGFAGACPGPGCRP